MHRQTPRQVKSFELHFGKVTVEHRHNGDRVLHIGAEQLVLQRENGKDLDATEVMDIRHLLTRAGWATKVFDPLAKALPAIDR